MRRLQQIRLVGPALVETQAERKSPLLIARGTSILFVALAAPGCACLSQAQGHANAAGLASNEEQIADRTRAQVDEVRKVVSMLPRVDVTHSAFGVGCPNPADPQGHSDSTCAINRALQFAEANPIKGGGYPVLYFPHGRYHVAGDGFTAALTLTHAIGLIGDGAQSTTIYNASPSAGTVAYNKASDCNEKPGPCQIEIAGITFAGAGHRSMGGLIEISSTDTGVMRDVVLAETGGIALNLQGGTERWIFSQVDIDHARWPVLTEGDTNENYFDRVNVIDAGADESHFCFSVNCPGGTLKTSGGTWYPDPHSAVFLDGDNVHWMNSSIKSTAFLGGIRLAAVDSSVAHTYVEGYPWGGQPRVNHAIEVGGKLELGHLTKAVSAGDMLIPVDDAGWQPLYVNDPALVNLNGGHSYTPAYRIFPADYALDSKEPSRAVAGISRGTSESIRVASFAGDGRAHLTSRAQDGTHAIAWPAGSVIEQSPPNGYGSARIESNHLNSIDGTDDKRFSVGCDDTAQLTEWTSSPSRLCAEIILGLVPDGYQVQFPSQHYIADGFTAEVTDTTIFTGTPEVEGQGWIKIPGNGGLTLDQGDGPLREFASADTALNTYINGNTRVQVVKWGDASALAAVHDLSANVSFSPQDHYYRADIQTGRSIGQQYLGDQCWYAIQPGGGQPASRFCIRATGPAQERLENGRWVPSGK
jgi:hypothetical protein